MNNIRTDIIDTRELHARYDELQEKIEDDVLDLQEQSDWNELLEMENYISDFWHGETLVPEDEFTEYARQLAEDIGSFSDNAEWPLYHIDWEAAADDLRQDYTEFQWQGQTYLARA